ncbi:MAG: hypothetical protein JSS02_21305 [Planctomycetes bacterium]|nr:hypothetical protein [Planctomycetota bacterium]
MRKKTAIANKKDARKKRLEELAVEVIVNYGEAEAAMQKSLEHVRRAGEALCEAYEILGKTPEWTRWHEENFKGSKEKRQVYMRIARMWNDPRIEYARKRGISIVSIRMFQKVLDGVPLIDEEVDWDGEYVTEKKEDYARREGRDWAIQLNHLIADGLDQMTDHELHIFFLRFETLWGDLTALVETIVEERSSRPDFKDALADECGSKFLKRKALQARRERDARIRKLGMAKE